MHGGAVEPPLFPSTNSSERRRGIWSIWSNLNTIGMASRYWVVSLPVQQTSSSTSLWSRLQDSISKNSFDTPLYRVISFLLPFCYLRSPLKLSFLDHTIQLSLWFLQFNIPNLRVGTLDSLLALSDDLVKVNFICFPLNIFSNYI